MMTEWSQGILRGMICLIILTVLFAKVNEKILGNSFGHEKKKKKKKLIRLCSLNSQGSLQALKNLPFTRNRFIFCG